MTLLEQDGGAVESRAVTCGRAPKLLCMKYFAVTRCSEQSTRNRTNFLPLEAVRRGNQHALTLQLSLRTRGHIDSKEGLMLDLWKATVRFISISTGFVAG